MEQNTPMHRDAIKKQLKDAYGKVVYTYTTHLKEASLLARKNAVIKVGIIMLSAISTCGILGVIFKWWEDGLAIITALVSLGNMVLGTYSKGANLEHRELQHRGVANRLWRIREKYLALLTDFDGIDETKLIERRDLLTEQVADVYDSAPLTSKKAYSLAQKALNVEEEQFFAEGEVDKMLPEHLR